MLLPFSGLVAFLMMIPGLSLCSNPGLRIAHAFGVLKSEPVVESAFSQSFVGPLVVLFF
jgi:hypothetical protein